MPCTLRSQADLLPQHGLNRFRNLNLGLREQLGHLFSMGILDVAVRPKDQFVAILVNS